MREPSAASVLRALPRGTRPLVAAILREARGRGAAVHLVGGPVRDFLLGREVRDVDLIVEAHDGEGAPELARAAAPADARVITHGRFGTACLVGATGRVDLASVRSESYAHPGALPSVAPGGLDEDLRRRDFTVNALAIPLTPAARRGRPALIGADDGIRDLERRALRVLHSRSFHDDPTRALRAARLGARLGFTLSRGSRSALHDALRDGAFGRVSGERLRHEFEKLFDDAVVEGSDPAAGLRLLDRWHVLGALEPGLGLPREAVGPLRRLGRQLAHPAWTPRRLRPWVAGLCVWLAPLAAGLRGRTLVRLAVQGEARSRIAGFHQARDRWLRNLAQARGRGAVDAVLRDLDEEALHALYAAAPPPLRRRIVRYAAEDRDRRPPVSGDDLVAEGLSGPVVGRALARIRAAHLDGRVTTRDEALALARELVRPGGGERASRRGRSAR